MTSPPGESFRRVLPHALPAFLILAAAVLRLYGLAENPPGLFRDEWEKGYTAYELIHTARHGIPGPEGIRVSSYFPLFIEVYEGHDRTSALYQYLSAPFVGIFGLSAWSTRLVAALAGVLAAIGAWRLASRLAGPDAGLIALAVMALSPACLIFSRWAQQGILVLPLALFGFLALLSIRDAETRNRRVLAVIGALLLALAAYAYDPARLVIPILVALFAVGPGWSIVRHERRQALTAGTLFVLLWLPLLVYTLTSGASRLERIGLGHEESGGGIAVTAVSNWIAHFDPAFLFVEGDANPRHRLPGAGLMGWGSALLLVAGLAAIGRTFWTRDEARWRTGVFVLGWFLVAPAAAALTRDGIPHALRANLMIPGAVLVASCATWWFSGVRGSVRRLCWVVVVVLLLTDGFQAVRGLVWLRNSPAGPWAGGVTEALGEALEARGIPYFSTGIPYANYAALFHERTPPRQYHEDGLGALRLQLVPPGAAPSLGEGDVFVGPPQSGLPMEMFEEYVLLYELRDGELHVRRAEWGPARPSPSF